MDASPYLTLAEAAEYLRYQTVSGFMHAVRSRNIPHIRRGRQRLFLRTDLERVWSRPNRKRPHKADEVKAHGEHRQHVSVDLPEGR